MHKGCSFQFSSHTFAACYHQQIILLDVLNNEYLSLDKNATNFLCFALNNKFNCLNGLYFPICVNEAEIKTSAFRLDEKHTTKFNTLINTLLKQKLIEPCFTQQSKKNVSTAIDPVSLSKFDWIPNKHDEIFKINIFELLEVFIVLIKIHLILRRKKLKGLLNLLISQSIKFKKRLNSSNKNINKIIQTLDKACLLFFKRTSCLPWAGTLTYLFLKNGFACNFVIGVQTIPFYAHAWVEVNNNVVNDNSELKERLAPILKLSFYSRNNSFFL